MVSVGNVLYAQIYCAGIAGGVTRGGQNMYDYHSGSRLRGSAVRFLPHRQKARTAKSVLVVDKRPVSAGNITESIEHQRRYGLYAIFPT